LLNEGGLVDLVGGFHCKLTLENIEHVVGSGISVAVLVHQFFHHFTVDEDVIHAFLEVA
jgi:hypothetical protein